MRGNRAVSFASLLLILAFVQGVLSANQLMRQAIQDAQIGKYGEAQQMLRRALRSAPRNPELWSYLGEIDSQLHDLNAAISSFEKVVSLTPYDSRAYFNLGALYMQRGATNKALRVYRQGLALSPDAVTANQNYAFLLMKTGKFLEAVRPLRKLKTMKSTDLSVRVALIESLLKCGKIQAGQGEISEFLNLPSVTPSDQSELATVLVEDHLFPAAQEVLECMIHRAPNCANTHAELGWLLLEQKSYKDAARQVGRAVQLAPASANYSMQLAQVLLEWQNYTTALAFLRAVKGRFGSLPDYQYNLAWANYGLGQIPEAAAMLENLTQHYPTLDLPHYSLGNCYLQLSRLKDAERQYRIAIRLNPQKSSYYGALGQMLRKEGNNRINEAIANLGKAISLNPADNQSEVQLALCYEQKGELGKAQELLQHVIQDQPDLLAAHRVLTRIYYREGTKALGDRESAIVARLDSEQLHRRERLLGFSATRP